MAETGVVPPPFLVLPTVINSNQKQLRDEGI